MSNHKEDFERLYSLNVNEYVEQKNGLNYLSWAYAWAEFKKHYPDATYKIKKDECGWPYFGHADIGYMVYTSITAGGLTYEMWLPVMDGANKAMKAQAYQYTVKNPNFKYATLDAATGKYFDRYGNEQTEYNTKTCDAMTMFDVNKAVMRCLVKNMAMFGLGLYIYAGEDLPEDIKQYNCECCGKPFEGGVYKGQKFTASWAFEQAKKMSNGKALCKECRNNKTESEV